MEERKGQLAARGEGNDTAWLCIYSLRLPPNGMHLTYTERILHIMPVCCPLHIHTACLTINITLTIVSIASACRNNYRMNALPCIDVLITMFVL